MRKDILVLICFLFLLSPINSFSQEKTVPDSNSIKILQLEEKLDRKVDSLVKEDKRLQEIITIGYENLKELNRYIIGAIPIFLALVTLFGAYGGMKYIQKKVEERVNKSVQEKVKEEFIKKIIQKEGEKKVKDLTGELEKKANIIISKADKKLMEISDLHTKYQSDLEELETIKDKKKEDFTIEEKEKIKDFTKTLSEFKDEKDYTADDWFWFARFELDNDNYDKAINYLSNTIELNSKFTNAYLFRGLAFMMNEKYDKSLNDYTTAIKLLPKNIAGYLGRGYTYEKLRDYRKAINDFKKVIELNPYYKGVFTSLIELLLISGEYKEGLEFIEKAYKLELKDKDIVIVKYCECIINEILGNETEDLDKELNGIIKKDFEFDWSFDEFENWLKDAKLSEDIKEYIREKTELLKKKKKK